MVSYFVFLVSCLVFRVVCVLRIQKMALSASRGPPRAPRSGNRSVAPKTSAAPGAGIRV